MEIYREFKNLKKIERVKGVDWESLQCSSSKLRSRLDFIPRAPQLRVHTKCFELEC